MDTDIYICSKPLQYFNVRNIGIVSTNSRRVLIVLGRFVDADKFFQHIKEFDNIWDDILFFTNQYRVDIYLFFHPANNLFVEVDTSFVYGIMGKLSLFKKMYVFEEGFGSYRRDRFDSSKGIKKWINKCTGVGTHVGFSKFLTGQYLYLPELYKNQFPGYPKAIMDFQKPFVERLREELLLFMKLSEGYEDFLSIRNKRIGIYLSNHCINDLIIQDFMKEGEVLDLLYVKLHPHIRDFEGLQQYNLNIIRSNIMIEFLLIILLDNGNGLTIFHENSTSVIWFQNKIIDRNMGEVFKEYDIVASYIKSKML